MNITSPFSSSGRRRLPSPRKLRVDGLAEPTPVPPSAVKQRSPESPIRSMSPVAHRISTLLNDHVDRHAQQSFSHTGASEGSPVARYSSSGTRLKSREQQSSLELSVSQEALLKRLLQDHEESVDRKDAEAQIRADLQSSQLELIEKYRLIAQNLRAEMESNKEKYEASLKSKDEWWTARMDEKKKEISIHEQQMKQMVQSHKQKLLETERRMAGEFEKQEVVWRERVEEVERRHNSRYEALHAQFELEKEAKELSAKARVADSEEKMKASYEKKLSKFESKLAQAMQAYKEKEFVIQGSLDEARREVMHLKNSFDAKQEVLQEELSVKDRRLVKMQAQLHAVDEITRIADAWRSTAREMARLVVRACVTTRDMPDVPVPPRDVLSSVFQGFVKEEERDQHRAHHMREVKVYNQLKADHVIVQKESLSIALKNAHVSLA